jgi:hypothetical protein
VTVTAGTPVVTAPSSATSFSASLPASVTTDGILLLRVSNVNLGTAAGAVTVSGWTAVDSRDCGAGNAGHAIFWRPADASDSGGSVTVSNPSAGSCRALVVQLLGADRTAPFPHVLGGALGSNATSFTTGALTVLSTNPSGKKYLLAMVQSTGGFFTHSAEAANGFTSPTLTEISDTQGALLALISASTSTATSTFSDTQSSSVRASWTIMDVAEAPTTTPLQVTTDLRWAVRAKVTRPADVRWGVRARLLRASDLRWAVRARVSRSADLQWAVRARVARPADLRWAVRAVVRRSSDVRWAVRQVLTRAADLRWAVRSRVTRTADVRWAVRTKVSRLADLRWPVRSRVPAPADLRWAVRALVRRTADLRWAVGALSLVPRFLHGLATLVVQRGTAVLEVLRARATADVALGRGQLELTPAARADLLVSPAARADLPADGVGTAILTAVPLATARLEGSD